jgi:uncharacterized protein YcfL
MRNLLVGLALTATLTACSQYTSGVSSTHISVDQMTDSVLVTDNPLLGSQITLVRAGIEPLEDGRSLAQVTLKSLYIADLDLQYRIYWFDENGTGLRSSSWRPIVVHGKQEVQLQSMSETTQATGFKVYVREISK